MFDLWYPSRALDAVADFFRSLLHLIREPGELIAWGGYPGLSLIVFLETGALVFFLPGDSLLVMAGLYAAQGSLSVWILNLLLIPAAILGAVASYAIGSRMGPRLFSKPRSRFFRPEHLQKAHAFYERHGGKAIVIARFMPIVRTFVPVAAGAARMPYGRFFLYSVVGAVAWVLSMTLAGFALGRRFPGMVKHIEIVIVVVVVASLIPAVVAYIRSRKQPESQGADSEQ